MLSVFWFSDFQVGVFLLQVIGVDEGGFVSQELFAGAEMFGEESSGFFLDDFFVLGAYCVPKLGLSLMHKIDSWEVKILGVPAEEGFPASDIAVRCVDSLDLVTEGIW